MLNKIKLSGAVLLLIILCTVTACEIASDYGMPIDGFVWIRPGEFLMGSPDGEPGHTSVETQHKVTLTHGFYMGKYVVTQQQYDDIDMTIPGEGGFPAVNVTWKQAVAFCNRLSVKDGLRPAYILEGFTDPDEWGNYLEKDLEMAANSNGYRLPTEAQWEYACRAGTTTTYNVGDIIASSDANFAAAYGGLTPVDQFVPNAWGLHDMHGNVWEIVGDLFINNSSYTSGDQIDPTGDLDGTTPIIRGGSCWESAIDVRSAKRLGWPNPGNNISFRLVRYK